MIPNSIKKNIFSYMFNDHKYKIDENAAELKFDDIK